MSQPSSTKKTREWEEKIRLQKESGKSVLRWCLEQKISYDSMNYWRKKFRSASAKIIDRSCFKELSDLTDKAGITIEYQQIRIHLAKNSDPSVLMKYLQTLKAEKC